METMNDATRDTAAQDFVITRVLDAPRALVFEAWTEAKHLEQWWGPKGFTLNVVKLDLRPGGIFHYSMQAHSGPLMWGRFIYREIVAPERIEFINSFSDRDGNITRAPFSKTWPQEMYNTLTLTEQEGKTLLTLRGRAYNATAEEQETYKQGHASLQQGFGGTFDQLEAYLARLTSGKA